jgi:putative addiction module CopG family antidote
MNAQLTLENEQFIQQEIAAGRYGTAAEVLNAGLEVLRQRQALLSRIDESRRQLDEGEFTRYDDEGLERRLNELHQQIDEIAARNEAPS